MAAHKPSMTRSSSTDSSALSNIDVSPAQKRDSSSDRVSASTPPTSLAETGSLGSGKVGKMPALDEVEEDSERRPKRVRSGISTYNLKKLSDAQLPATAGSSRNVSGLTGRTLVDGRDQEETTPFGSKVDEAMHMDWELPAGASQKKSPGRLQRKPSVKDRVKKVAGKVGSVLGKRGRDVLEAGKRRLGKKDVEDEAAEEDEEEEELPRWKKELDTGAKGLLDEMDLDADVDLLPPPPAKRARLSGKAPLREISQPKSAPSPLTKASTAGKRMKKWQKEGLYVGQDPDFDPTAPGGRKKLQKKRPDSSASDATLTGNSSASKRSFVTLPMFSYLDKQRDFIIPFDVFAPSFKKGDEKPKDWHQLNKNRLVGEARELWEKSEKLPASMCVCQPPDVGDQGCDDHCLNRVMQYECNDENCNLPASDCGNRSFSELATRMKKGGAFDVGVEVLKTENRGFGVRSCRTFAPGQIIMEYTGEIISEGECQRRMREEYQDKQCYYLMELERGLIIDGTKGSMARFINHSCEPNCEVRMVKVNGTPRMGVFAGEDGIVTGEELTYDYNFDNFGKTRQICYCGAPNCRGYLSKRLNASEIKKAAKEESERKRKAAEEAQRHAEDEERKKRVKTDRGSSWRGWVAVDDPETKERLKQEKKEREEAEKSSSRAQRLAARRGSLPATEKAPVIKKGDSQRRKTLTIENKTVRKTSTESADGATFSKPASRKSHTRTLSTGSKFTEDLPRPTSVHSTAAVTRKTEVSVTKVRQQSISEEIAAVEKTAEVVEKTVNKKRKRPLLDAAKSIGQAVKNGLKGNEKPQGANGKLKQSTLSFGKMQ
ncbi:hypothetical protein LTR36_005576 [Oleoguttula mirabilis]|uniref:Histone-lysine N-methyltransferase n=1 Tax=Oleoguttula mirabilis TaxID=1507867 RepID=A0AAV9JFZ8_9PEZI|nr:hypothetical protein LTR36_005576 [Oleoguttula mirabilis]